MNTDSLNQKVTTRAVLSLLLFLFASYSAEAQKITRQATVREENQKTKGPSWQPLFVQKQDTIHWKSAQNKSFPNDGWLIKNDEFLLLSGRKGGDLITKKKYTGFELEFEFKMTELVNSGIKYFVNEMRNLENGKTELIGFEYQIIDDFNQDKIAGFDDAKGSTGALYLLCAPKKDKHLNPPGEWNSAKIKVRRGKTTHWLNGQKIVHVNIGNSDFQKLIQQTKFRNYPGYGHKTNGHLLIQDHGSQIHYRNIRIREL
ncbi:MAG: DUF1080 domain-containing protein [Mangrovibacterium sp.]|nr:DUF1080 domain-containing protein [Mangrovibacterium sp.]